MKVELNGVAKRYRTEWILKPFNLTLPPGSKTAVTGPNGSGKSTLLRILSGHLTPSKGRIVHSVGDTPLEKQEVYRHLTYAAPYIDLIEEFTLRETLHFHFRFKETLPELKQEEVVRILGMEKHLRKQVQFFSSGMKQRLKLVLALCSVSDLILLDEPGTTLDAQGLAWYHQLVARFGGGRTIVVASNVEADYSFCDRQISVLDMK